MIQEAAGTVFLARQLEGAARKACCEEIGGSACRVGCGKLAQNSPEKASEYRDPAICSRAEKIVPALTSDFF